VRTPAAPLIARPAGPNANANVESRRVGGPQVGQQNGNQVRSNEAIDKGVGRGVTNAQGATNAQGVTNTQGGRPVNAGSQADRAATNVENVKAKGGPPAGAGQTEHLQSSRFVNPNAAGANAAGANAAGGNAGNNKTGNNARVDTVSGRGNKPLTSTQTTNAAGQASNSAVTQGASTNAGQGKGPAYVPERKVKTYEPASNTGSGSGQQPQGNTSRTNAREYHAPVQDSHVTSVPQSSVQVQQQKNTYVPPQVQHAPPPPPPPVQHAPPPPQQQVQRQPPPPQQQNQGDRGHNKDKDKDKKDSGGGGH
jgi:hypothetical protein